MSRVTNLMLSCSCSEDDDRKDHDVPAEFRDPTGLSPGLKHVAAWCQGGEDRAALGFPGPIDSVSGGTKHMECLVYAWGANYLDLAGFMAAVATAPWECPEAVQVFVMGDEDDRWRVYGIEEIKGGQAE